MKRLVKLTALLLAFVMIFTVPASASGLMDGISLDQYDAETYMKMLSAVKQYGIGASVYEYFLDELENLDYSARYEQLTKWQAAMSSLYTSMVAYYESAYPGGSLICTCDVPQARGGLHTDENCPWHFAQLPLAEQYSTISSLSADDVDVYLQTVGDAVRSKLQRINLRAYTAEAEQAEVSIAVPEGAFAEDYLLTAESAEPTAAMLEALGENATVAAFDISFRSIEDESVKYQPAAGAPVALTFDVPTAALADAEGETYLQVYHMAAQEDGSYVAEPVTDPVAVDPDATVQTLSVAAEAFSIYLVVNGTPTGSDLDDTTYKMTVGETITLTSDYKYNYGTVEYRWSWDTNQNFSVTTSNTRTVNVTANSAGTITLKFQYQRNNGKWKTAESVTITATQPLTGKVRVYVYVAGKAWQNNLEFMDLIKLYACDQNLYFPAGEITLDASYFTGKDYTTVGAPLINSEDDWAKLLASLGDLDTSKLKGTDGVKWSGNGIMDFSANAGNLIKDYIGQAAYAKSAGMGSQLTALFRWNGTTSYGFEDQSVQYHLDLCFNTKKITFKTGNNGITTEEAKDGIEVDSRAYITGSLIQPPRNLYIPAGYQFVGYYTDADFTTKWDGIGTPLNEDTTVYIKIAPLENVVIHYEVVEEGTGTVTPDNESLNPETGVAVGSTPTAAEGYKFVGWYKDEECTEPVDADWVDVNNKITPQKDTYSEEKKSYVYVAATYYAKFVRNLTTLTIKKSGMDNGESAIINVSGPGYSGKVVVPNGESVTLFVTCGEYTITEVGSWTNRYTTTVTGLTDGKVTLTADGAEVSFTNSKKNDKWLHDESAIANFTQTGTSN